MGCSTSRLDHLPAVALCHHRCKFLHQALHQSYALADAHFAYMQSLMAVGHSLRHFLDLHSSDNGDLPAVTKSSPLKSSSPGGFASSSSLDSSSDSEEEEFNHETVIPSLFHGYHYSSCSPPGGSAWKTPSPPAPSSSTWDFLNFFEAYERFEVPTKNEFQAEPKITTEKMKLNTKIDNKQNGVPVLKKNEFPEKEQKQEKKISVEVNNRSACQVSKQIEDFFVSAAESGNGVLTLLDTGKFRCYNNNSVYRGVSCKLLHKVTPSISVLPSKITDNFGSINLGFEQDLAVKTSVNLSSTLQKLCVWQKKLYDEVKAAEKLHVAYLRNYRQIRSLGVTGSGDSTSKTCLTRTLLDTLSTNIKVAIQVIDRISVTISELRDEELWPQISDLIEKLLGMWKAMLECHRCQSQAMVEVTVLDSIAFSVKFNDVHLEAIIQLKIDLQNWNLSLFNWITAQRGYVKALNGWLLKCLSYEPEEIPDSNAQGEPPVFGFCNQWSLAIDKISETEVIDAIHGFFIIVNQILERHYVYIQQRRSTDKELEKKMKILESAEQRMQKMFQASRNATGSLSPEMGSLQVALKQVFTAIERFSESSVQTYKELHVHIQNGRVTQDENTGSILCDVENSKARGSSTYSTTSPFSNGCCMFTHGSHSNPSEFGNDTLQG